MAASQDRLDDYLNFGVTNVWVVDPWKHRGWRVTADGWATAADGIMRTDDGRIAMPLVVPYGDLAQHAHGPLTL